MRSHHALLPAVALCATTLAAPRLHAQATGSTARTTAASGQAQQQQRGERRIICRGAPIPAGWILVDDLKDRTMCGGENPAVYNAYNVWAIERYDNRSAGSYMEVCASSPMPPGWNLVDMYRNKDTCGHPSDAFVVNAKRIRKAN